MSPDHTRRTFQKLFAAALLSCRLDLGDDRRREILAACPLIESENEKELAEALVRVCRNMDSLLARPKGSLKWPTSRQILQALNQARAWLAKDISVLTVEELRPSARAGGAVPPLFFGWGGPKGLNQPRAAVLNSRKPRRIRPEDRWIQVTAAQTKEALREALCLVSSLGNYQYELVAFLAGQAGTPLMIICDGHLPMMASAEKSDVFFDEYGEFLGDRTLLLSPFTPGTLPPIKQRGVRRDACVAALSDSILVAEARAGGNVQRLAAEAMNRKADVRVYRPDRFDRATSGNKMLLGLGARAWDLTAGNTLKKTRKKAVRKGRPPSHLDGDLYLFHYTRSCPGPWPGQTRAQYYRSLVERHNNASHTGFDTLDRILSEQKIRGGSRLTRGRSKAVSLTACGLDELQGLIRWRPGLIRWTLEPYGLALPRRVLLDLGAAPVLYGDEEVWSQLPQDQRFRFQLHRPPRTDWSGEKEWRLSGDLDLAALSPSDIKVIVPTEEEAALIAQRHGLETVLAGGFDRRY